jgi:hypothetical protein
MYVRKNALQPESAILMPWGTSNRAEDTNVIACLSANADESVRDSRFHN